MGWKGSSSGTGGGGGGGSDMNPTIVFQPGGVAAGNVQTTWAGVMATLNAVAPASANGTRPPTVIQIDDSFVSPAVMPAGAYNLDSVRFAGVSSFATNSGGSQLNFAAGVTIAAGTLDFDDSVFASFSGAVPCISVTGATQECNISLSRGAALMSLGAGVFVNVAAGFLYLRADGDCQIGDGAHALLNLAGGGLEVQAYGSANVLAGAVTGAGAVVAWDTQIPGAQGLGVAVDQVGGTFTVPVVAAAGFTQEGGVIQGSSFSPLVFGETAGISIAAGLVLSAAQAALPVQQYTGVLGGNETVTFPSKPGAVWDVDLSGATIGVNTLTLQAGTGAGGTTSVTAAQLAATGTNGIRVACTAANKLVRVS